LVSRQQPQMHCCAWISLIGNLSELLVRRCPMDGGSSFTALHNAWSGPINN
jgi:hypothetical protein